MRWGLIPHWAKDIKIGFLTINARAKEADTNPAFREAFQRRRCLVPLDSFYDGKTATGKQPYAIALADRRLMGMARVVGDLALAGGRAGAQLHDRHDHTKRIVRRVAQPDAGGSQAASMAGLARRTGGDRA